MFLLFTTVVIAAGLVTIDLLTEVEKKIAKNAAKYPVEKSKGSSKKYSDL
jgi:hypothetical protein